MIPQSFCHMAHLDELREIRELLHYSTDDGFQSFFKLQPGAVSSDGSAVVGHSGFLFVNDGSNSWKSQISGSVALEPTIYKLTLENLRNIKDRLLEKSINFRFVVVPEKDVVYPELSPNVNGVPAAGRPVLALNNEVPDIIYPLEALKAGREFFQTFHARNSHFNFYGGLIVADAVLHSLGYDAVTEYTIKTDIVRWPDDLSMKWFEDLKTSRRMVGRVYNEHEIRSSASHVGRYLLLRNVHARDPGKLVIFGDSYSWNPDAGLCRFLSLVFQEVHFLWQKNIDWDLIEAIKPHTVVVQSAERFLIKGVF